MSGLRLSLIVAVVALSVLLTPAVSRAQLPVLEDGSVGMGHLHVLVSEADFASHRKAWIEGLGARAEKVGPLEALLIPGVMIVIKKGDSSGGSEGSTVNHLGFMVRDLEKTVARWESLGFGVFEERPSPTQAFLRFPGNIKVELSEHPELANAIEHHHVHLFTDDVDGMQKWYLDTFGGRAGQRGRFKEVWLPGVRVSFGPVDEKPVGSKGRAVDHIGFEVGDLAGFIRKAEAKGIKFDVPYREVPAINASIAFLTDPWGTYIEMTDGLDKVR